MFSANVVVRLLIKSNLTTVLEFNAGVKESIDLKQYIIGTNFLMITKPKW